MFARVRLSDSKISTNLLQDAPTARAGKHIVFGSDDDDDDDDKDEQQPTTSELPATKKSLLRDEEAASNKNGPTKETVSGNGRCSQSACLTL